MSQLNNLVAAFNSKNVAVYEGIANYLRDEKNLFKEIDNDKAYKVLSIGKSNAKASGFKTVYLEHVMNPSVVIGITFGSPEDYQAVMFFIVDREYYDKKLVKKYVQAHKNGNKVEQVLYPRASIDGVDDKLFRHILGINKKSNNKGYEADHVLSPRINTKEALRSCSHQENSFNKASTYGKFSLKQSNLGYSIVIKADKSSSMREQNLLNFMQLHGVSAQLTKGKVYVSQPYTNKAEALNVMKHLRQIYYSAFEYNPLNDLTHSFYLGLLMYTGQINFDQMQLMRAFEYKYIEKAPQDKLDYYGIPVGI